MSIRARLKKLVPSGYHFLATGTVVVCEQDDAVSKHNQDSTNQER
jgi:hypothetical protein